jgi:hypothetical protein
MNPRKPRDTRPAMEVPVEVEAGTALYVDPARLDPDYDYTFIRDEVMGQPDKRNRADAIRRGYVPVSATEIGHEAVRWPGDTTTDDFVRDAGSILMKRPKARANAERERQFRDTTDQMRNSIQDITQFMQVGDPRYVQRAPETGVRELGVDRGKFADA